MRSPAGAFRRSHRRHAVRVGPAFGVRARASVVVVVAATALAFGTASLGFVSTAAAEPPGVLSIFAGTGIAPATPPADPCPAGATSCAATSADIAGPGAIATDSAGDLFVPDGGNNVVEEVTPSGQLSIVAGTVDATGTGPPARCTSDGSDCSALATGLSNPTAVALDGKDLYVADEFNQLVEEVDLTTGHIWRVAGGGTEPTGEIGPCGSTGTGPNQILIASCSATGITTTLFYPADIAVNDSTGDLYIADGLNNTVDQVSSSGTLSVFAGDGQTPPYVGPTGSNQSLGSLCISAPGQTCSATASNNALEASGVGVNQSNGDVYIGDDYTQQVLQVTPSGTESALAGCFGFCQTQPTENGPATDEPLANPAEIQVDTTGDVFFPTSGIFTGSTPTPIYYESVDEVTPAGQLSIIAGEPGARGTVVPGPALDSPFSNYVDGIAFDSAGDLYISDNQNNQVLKETFPVPPIAPTAVGPSRLSFAAAVRRTESETVTITNSGTEGSRDRENHARVDCVPDRTWGQQRLPALRRQVLGRDAGGGRILHVAGRVRADCRRVAVLDARGAEQRSEVAAHGRVVRYGVCEWAGGADGGDEGEGTRPRDRADHSVAERVRHHGHAARGDVEVESLQGREAEVLERQVLHR